jgi:hypothetical protein
MKYDGVNPIVVVQIRKKLAGYIEHGNESLTKCREFIDRLRNY